MKQALVYMFNVWATTILLGPLLYNVPRVVLEPQYPHQFEYTVRYGLILSLPSIIVSFIAVALIRLIPMGLISKKILISVVGIFLVALSLYVLKGGWYVQGTEYLIGYGGVMLTAIWVYKLG